jgi:hypothetical protein
VGQSVYPLIVARKQLGKDVPAATKIGWRRCFLAIISSHLSLCLPSGLLQLALLTKTPYVLHD